MNNRFDIFLTIEYTCQEREGKVSLTLFDVDDLDFNSLLLWCDDFIADTKSEPDPDGEVVYVEFFDDSDWQTFLKEFIKSFQGRTKDFLSNLVNVITSCRDFEARIICEVIDTSVRKT